MKTFENNKILGLHQDPRTLNIFPNPIQSLLTLLLNPFQTVLCNKSSFLVKLQKHVFHQGNRCMFLYIVYEDLDSWFDQIDDDTHVSIVHHHSKALDFHQKFE